MTEKIGEIRVKDLDTVIARALLVSVDLKPNDSQYARTEGIVTKRPGWAKLEPDKLALPGGKIILSDFEGIVDPNSLIDPEYVFTDTQLNQAAMKAVEREILEELNIVLPAGLLGLNQAVRFENQDELGKTWHTIAFAGVFTEKPEAVVKPESGGTIWIGLRELIDPDGENYDEYLSGHPEIIRELINSLV